MTAKNNSAVSAAKALIALFTRPSAKVQSALFITQSSHPKASVFGGTLAGVRVSAFLRTMPGKKPFLSFSNDSNVQVATGNVVVRDDGIPVVKLVMADKSIVWVNVSKNVNDAMLELLGANMTKLHTRTVRDAKEAIAA